MEIRKPPRLEDLERRLTVLEEKLFAVLLAATPDDEIVTVRAEADRELSSLPAQNAGRADRSVAKAVHPQKTAGEVRTAAIEFVLHVKRHRGVDTRALAFESTASRP